MKLSIVSTMYRSSSFLEEFAARIASAAEKITRDYELILVNDGSPDDSLDVALRLQERNPNIRVVDLSRNFGHHAAIVAGLKDAVGDRVFLMDCDLEEQPEWLSFFEEEMGRSGADVVYGVQKERVGSWASNIAGELFWRGINVFSSVRIPRNPMTCRLMSRAYVDALLDVGDRVLYLGGVFAWTGFRQQPLPLVKIPRPRQYESTYRFSRKMLQVVESFTSFSIAPLVVIFVTGLLIWLASVVYGIFLLVYKVLRPGMVMSGFTSLMLSIWFLSGIMIATLGIVGFYISRIFQEVKRRPLYIVRKVYKAREND